MSASALCALLSAQPSLADGIPALGHIPRLFRQMTVHPSSTVLVLRQLALSDVSINIYEYRCI